MGAEQNTGTEMVVYGSVPGFPGALGQYDEKPTAEVQPSLPGISDFPFTTSEFLGDGAYSFVPDRHVASATSTYFISPPDQPLQPEPEEPTFGVPTLYAEGQKHDEIFHGKEEERFPTNIWYIGTRNERLYEVVAATFDYMRHEGVDQAVDLPDELRDELAKRYADFEIACQTAIAELGFDPVELRQRTLAYRERKYDLKRMAQIRQEMLARDNETGYSHTEDALNAAVKRAVKLENRDTSRMDDSLDFSHVEVKKHGPQQELTAAWEDGFTHGAGQSFEHGLNQLASELDESQAEVLSFFLAYRKGMSVDEALTPEQRYNMAAEIDDVGVAGLSILNHLGIDIEPIMEERLALREERYNPEVIHAYYEYYDDMRLALEATRQTEGYRTPEGVVYQMNLFVHPEFAQALPEARKTKEKLERYSPRTITQRTGEKGSVEEGLVYSWRDRQVA